MLEWWWWHVVTYHGLEMQRISDPCRCCCSGGILEMWKGEVRKRSWFIDTCYDESFSHQPILNLKLSLARGVRLLIPQPPQQQQRYSITVAGLGLEMCPMCLEPSVSFIIIVIFLFSTNSFFKIRMIYNKNNKRNLNTFINNHRKASTSPRPIPLR